MGSGTILALRDERCGSDSLFVCGKGAVNPSLVERLICGPSQCKPDLLWLAAEHGGYPSVGPRWPLVLVQKQLGGLRPLYP